MMHFAFQQNDECTKKKKKKKTKKQGHAKYIPCVAV